MIVKKDDGSEEVFQHVLDAYLCVRQQEPTQDSQNNLIFTIETKSYSWGSSVREIVKELAQSLIELQTFLKENSNRKRS